MYCTFSVTVGSEPIFCLFAVEDGPWGADVAGATISSFERCEPGRTFSELLEHAYRASSGSMVVVRRNPRAIVRSDHIANALVLASELKAKGVDWSVLAGGGLGQNGERHIAHYSAVEPFLAFHPETRVIFDVFPDTYVLSRERLGDFLELGLGDVSTAFEPLFVQIGMKVSKLAFYDPRLGCAINGSFLRRDAGALRREFQAVEQPPARDLSSLWGTFRASLPSSSSSVRDKDASACNPLPSFAKLKREALKQIADPLSLSIVVRTLFKRPHLIHRLMASIVRASIADVELEIVLSTDMDIKEATEGLKNLQHLFPTLTLRLAHNSRTEEAHSRVRNLFGGATKATKQYIWFIDDDDYVDPEAMRVLSRQVYFGIKPVFYVGTAVHNEKWDVRNNGVAVLEDSRFSHTWEADGWRKLFTGVNRVPVCGAIMPRDLLLTAIDAFEFRHDFSEDYVLQLLLLTQSDLPAIVEIPEVMSHVSIREVGENTMNLSDRTQWCVDIHGFLWDLMYGRNKLHRSAFRYMPAMRVEHAMAPADVATSNAQTEMLDSQLRVHKRQIEYLSRLIAGK